MKKSILMLKATAALFFTACNQQPGTEAVLENETQRQEIMETIANDHLYSFTEKGMEHAPVLQNNDWVAPKSADNLKNPFKGDETALKKGKITYQNMCAICHGDKGKGDGMAGMSLKPKPSNFTSEKVQSQSDGALFWKLTTGRAPMAAYKDIISEEQRWQLVNYIRTFKKQ